MSGYLGSFIIDDTCTFYANSHTPATGAAVDADAVPGFRIYEDETGTPILTGTMALLDDANTTGFYSEQITLSAANGFEAGKSYCIRITLVVGAVTGTQLQTLQIGARVDMRMLGGGVQSATDLKDFADDGYDPGTNKVQGVVLTDTVTTYTGNTPQTGDNFARIGATGSGLTSLATQASVTTIDDFLDSEVTTLLADLDDIQARLPAALVAGRIDASVGAMAAGVLTATAIAADALTAAKLAADVTTELQAGLATAAAVAALNNLSATGVENAVWDAVMADHLDAGSTGASLNGAGSAGDPWTTAIPGAYGAGTAGNIVGTNLNATVSSRASQASVDTVDDFLDTEIGAIKTVTDALPNAGALTTIQSDLDNLQTRVPAALVGGRMDASVGAMAADTLTATAIAADAITAAKLAADVTTELQTGLATAANLATVAGYLDTEIAAIKAVTDALPNAGALTSLATQASVDTIDNFLDTEVAAILAAVDTEIGLIKAKTDTLPSGIQKNTALSNFSFLMIDSTDHVSPKTGLTVTATRSLDGAAFAACANAVTELASGIYKITLAAGDLNGDVVVLRFSAVGSDDRFITLVTEP